MLKFTKPGKLLNIDNNAKTVKGQKYGVKTAILYMAPADLSGFNLCAMASDGCKFACLNTAGQSIYPSVQLSRINKARWYMQERDTFLEQLEKELTNFVKRCELEGYLPAVRLNGTSDIPWENSGIMQKFPQIQFYDYTKYYKRAVKWASGKMPKNYHITFSLDEENQPEAFKVLKRGGNIAAVFRKALPKKYKGYRVIDGDQSDIRFQDKKQSIVGLIAKGKAKKDETGFVLDAVS